MNIGQLIEGDIVSLAFGGNGIMRSEGFVIFVPFTAIGDRILCRITKSKKNYAEGDLVKLIVSSPQRVKPRCPYFGRCGGCQLQHLNYEAQLDYKRQSVEDALKRLAKLHTITVQPVIPAAQQWEYRRRINLKLRPTEKGFNAGYIAIDNSSLITISQCQIFTAVSNPIIKIVQNIASSLEALPENKGNVTILKQDDERFILHFWFDKLPCNLVEVLDNNFKSHSEIAYILATSSKDTWSIGDLECKVELDGLKFNFSPEAFIQNHPEQSQNIYKELIRLANNSTATHVLDLYCGIGISSLLLASSKRKVMGIESNKNAIYLAKKNQNLNKIQNVEFLTADVEQYLQNCTKKRESSFVIVNPPRIGISDASINHLLSCNPLEIVYISCMPPTLARDLEKLCQKDYKVSSIVVYDMFPQTSHVETLVHLVRA